MLNIFLSRNVSRTGIQVRQTDVNLFADLGVFRADDLNACLPKHLMEDDGTILKSHLAEFMPISVGSLLS